MKTSPTCGPRRSSRPCKPGPRPVASPWQSVPSPYVGFPSPRYRSASSSQQPQSQSLQLGSSVVPWPLEVHRQGLPLLSEEMKISGLFFFKVLVIFLRTAVDLTAVDLFLVTYDEV